MTDTAPIAPAPIAAVRMTGISKSFGGVRALERVDLEVLPGEIHALLGGNGAGKSTILKVLNGVHVPDEGMSRWQAKGLPPRHRKRPEPLAWR